jgi:DUF971 family protein
MPLPLDSRKKPANVKVHVSTGAGVDVTWSDGHVSHYDFVYLRDLCPCALCDDERKKKAGLAGPSGAGAAGAVLPMFKPKPKARAAAAVGNYAIQFEFTDGHSTGIYSFDYLRTICPCEACAREFRSTPES